MNIPPQDFAPYGEAAQIMQQLFLIREALSERIVLNKSLEARLESIEKSVGLIEYMAAKILAGDSWDHLVRLFVDQDKKVK